MWSPLALWSVASGASGLLLTDTTPPGADGWWQYGALGSVALLAVYAVKVMFARQVQFHERDIARADKAEEALAELNKLIRDQLVVQLTRATDAIGRVAEQMGDARRFDEHKGR